VLAQSMEDLETMEVPDFFKVKEKIDP